MLCSASPKDGLVFAVRYRSTSPKADVVGGEATADVRGRDKHAEGRKQQ